MNKLLKSSFAVATALIATTLLFLAIPISNYMSLQGNRITKEKTVAINMTVKLPTKKKTPPKRRKVQKPTKAKSRVTPKAMARNNLSMDLGPGGNGGAELGSEAGSQAMALNEGEADVEPRLIQPAKAPGYPKDAQKAGVSGLVLVEVTVNESGVISNMEFLETPGNYGFEEEVRKALGKWKFKPAELNGVAVAVRLQYPFEF